MILILKIALIIIFCIVCGLILNKLLRLYIEDGRLVRVVDAVAATIYLFFLSTAIGAANGDMELVGIGMGGVFGFLILEKAFYGG